MKCKLKFVSYYLHEAGSAVSTHRHDCYEMVYYLSGSGWTVIDGVRHEFGPNQFAIIEPGCGHDEYRHIETQVLFMGFTFEEMEIRLVNGIYRDGGPHPFQHHLQQIRAEMIAHQKYYEIKLDLILGELLIELTRLDLTDQRKSGDLAYAISYLDENYNQPVDLAILAELSGYSYHRFRHLFKLKTGKSPVNYLIGQRLAQARILLRQTDMPIARIAQECGFYNESQLSTMFRREFAQSPSQFRRSAQ